MKRIALGIVLSALLGTAQAATFHLTYEGKTLHGAYQGHTFQVTYQGHDNNFMDSFFSREMKKHGSLDHYQGFIDSYFGHHNFHDFESGKWKCVTAVPEPETYAMMLAGLGLIGFVAARRRKNTEV